MDVLDELDRRARSAAADLRVAVAATVENELLPSRRWLAAVAVAAVVLLAVGLLVVNTKHETVTAGVDDTDFVHVAPTYLPEGVRLDVVVDEDAGVMGNDGWERLYGRGTAADPFADADLLVSVTDWPAADPFVATASGPYEAVTVGTVDGLLLGPPTDPHRRLVLQPDPGHIVFLSSTTLGEDVLLAVAAGVTLDDDTSVPTIDPAAIPAHLTVVATADGVVSAGAFGLTAPTGARSISTTWTDDRGNTGFTMVLAQGAGRDVELLNRYQLGPDVEAVSIGVASGWWSPTNGAVFWRVAPDELVGLRSQGGIASSELLRIARGIEVVDDDTWDDLAAGAMAHHDSVTTTVVASRHASNGAHIDDVLRDGRTTTVDREDDSGYVCAHVEVTDGTGGALCVPPDSGAAVVHYDGGVPLVVFGEAAAGTTAVRATIDGREVSATVADGDSFWSLPLARLGIETVPTEVVEYDADGIEIGRLPVNP